ncbi:MAG: histidine kinase [Betaproteobacteria bacterium]|nr:histidine kinase [Betaproteobacteria bacterium]
MALAAADFATLPRNLVLAAIFNALIAAGVAVAQHHPFSEALVFSNCIGFNILLLIDFPRRLVWGRRIPPSLPLAALSAIGIAAGFALGTTLACALLGRPLRANLSGDGLVTGAVITFFAGIAGCWYFMTRERVAQMRLAAEAHERSATVAQLKLLQAQIEPHFLFNTLANLHSLIATDPARAQKMLEHLNDYLRATLQAARDDTGTLGEEFGRLRGYLEVLAIRMGPRLRFTLSLPAELASARIPPMLLQPLVENAIKHGVEPKVEGGTVAIAAFRDAKGIAVTIEDSGLGLKSGGNGGSGVGLQNVRQRLAGVGGSLELADNAAGGVTVTARIPA